MAETERRADETNDEDPAKSGPRRIELPSLPKDDALPPPPGVLRERPRISTGGYAIIVPGERRKPK